MSIPPPPSPPATRVGFLPRLLAEIVDVAAVWVLGGAAAWVVWRAGGGAGAGEDAAGAFAALTGIAVLVGYFTFLHANLRQTLGKRLIGAVVVSTGQAPIGPARALARLCAELASAMPFNLGYLWAIWDPQRQTFHDKIAGTLVVRRTELSG